MGAKMFNQITASYGSEEEGLKRWTQAYLACVAAVDDNVGQVMDALNQTQLKDNTVVVLASDHGFHMGEKDYLYKNSLWEKSTRIPLIIRVPGMTKANTSINKAVSLIDVYPTLVDLCGLSWETQKNEKGHPLDGYTMKELLENPNAKTWKGDRPALTVVYAGSDYEAKPICNTMPSKPTVTATSYTTMVKKSCTTIKMTPMNGTIWYFQKTELMNC